MNIPSIYRKATAGFTIPPRKLSQMLVSAAQGAFSLISEPNRVEFIGMLENGTIQEGVLAQATLGPAMMLSLFHDLQNPLFKKVNFNISEFMEGVGPALANFHNVGGALENRIQKMIKESASIEGDAKVLGDETDHAKTNNDDSKVEKSADSALDRNQETEKLLAAMKLLGLSEKGQQAAAILEHEWSTEAQKDPDSLPGRLSRMVTPELFHMLEMHAKTAFLLDKHAQNITFQENSCHVNNVALLNARCVPFVQTITNSDDADSDSKAPQFEAVEYDLDDTETDSKTSVAAQMEVLYDVTQEYLVDTSAIVAMRDDTQSNDNDRSKTHDQTDSTNDSTSSKSPSSDPEVRKNTLVFVATLEGWLKGGPDNQLRWRLALHRPAFEFPGIEHSY